MQYHRAVGGVDRRPNRPSMGTSPGQRSETAPAQHPPVVSSPGIRGAPTGKQKQVGDVGRPPDFEFRRRDGDRQRPAGGNRDHRYPP